MARYVDRIDHNPCVSDRIVANQVTPDPTGCPQDLRHPSGTKIGASFRNKRLLQLFRLKQVTVDGLVQLLKFVKRFFDQLVLPGQFLMHVMNAAAGGQPGPKL